MLVLRELLGCVADFNGSLHIQVLNAGEQDRVGLVCFVLYLLWLVVVHNLLEAARGLAL